MTEEEQLVEILADLSHEQWSGWMRYLFSKCSIDQKGNVLIPQYYFDRWSRQMCAPYKELPEMEKDSDRIEARKVIERIEKYISEQEDE